MNDSEEALSARAVSLMRAFSLRGWTLGGFGSLSLLLSKEPFRLLLTPEVNDLGALRKEELLTVDSEGRKIAGASEKPSADWMLHLEILRSCGVRAIFHTQSVWDLLIADANEASGSFHLRGFHALSRLSGGETAISVPTVPFRADSEEQCSLLRERLRSHAPAPAVLIRGRGLYSWGRDFDEAKRKTEVLALLIETCARAQFSVLPAKVQRPSSSPLTHEDEASEAPHLHLVRGNA